MPASRLSRPRQIIAGLAAAAMVGAGVTAVAATAADPGGPVDRSVQQVYLAGTATTPSTPVADYAGELLTLQAVKVGNTAAEPTLGVTSDGTAFYAAGTLAVDTAVTWGGITTDTMRSTDGGVTWESVQHKVLGAVTAPPANADPFVYVDPATDRVFNLDLYAGCSWLNYSDDNAKTWQTNPAACGNMVNDHQTIAAGKPRPGQQTSGYPNVLYYCFNRVADANCGRSLDGGTVWTPTPQPAFLGYDQAAGGLCGGLHGHIETDPQGRLFMPKGHCSKPWIAISEDGGDSWKRVKVSDMSAAGPHVSVASDTAGNLYYVWWDRAQRLPYLSISRDSGKTWGAPRMIAPPGVTEVNFPVISAGDPGRIAVSFPSSTSETRSGATRPWNQHVVISTNALDDAPLFLSATANDPADPIHRGNCNGRCGGLWDFQDIVIAGSGEMWSSAADDCVAACVTGQAVALHNGEGIAVRQIGGPLLREAAEGRRTITAAADGG